MTLAERVADTWYGLLDRIRHAEAGRVSAGPERSFDALEGHQHCLVVTYRRSGEGVPTPVWFGLADGKVYFRTEERVAKTRRIRANDRVVVAPCDSRGKPLGAGVEGRARVLGPADEAHAESAIQANFGVGRRLYKAASNLGSPMVYVEVTPVPSDENEAAA